VYAVSFLFIGYSNISLLYLLYSIPLALEKSLFAEFTVMFSRLVHPPKTLYAFIVSTPLPIVTVFKLVHLSKVDHRISLTLFGILILCILVQLPKQASPKLSTVFGKVTVFRL